MEQSSTPSTRYALLSVAETAKQIRCGRWFVYDLVKAGKLAFHRIGGRICISQTDLDSYVSKARHAALGEKRSTAKSKEISK
jgi:excisionase family DNA binding protein